MLFSGRFDVSASHFGNSGGPERRFVSSLVSTVAVSRPCYDWLEEIVSFIPNLHGYFKDAMKFAMHVLERGALIMLGSLSHLYLSVYSNAITMMFSTYCNLPSNHIAPSKCCYDMII